MKRLPNRVVEEIWNMVEEARYRGVTDLDAVISEVRIIAR